MKDKAKSVFLSTCLFMLVASSAYAAQDWWKPMGILSWDWQLTEPFRADVPVQMIDLDLFDTSVEKVRQYQKRGSRVVCYINVGAWENWREDKNDFPQELLGKSYDDWAGERWLDIRRIHKLSPILKRRFDLCRDKGFDGIEPDNVDGYQNNTGFKISNQDQLKFNRFLAAEAHKRGLSIGLKNDPDQMSELVHVFDWAMVEDCYAQGWCQATTPFIKQNKTVFAAEYTDETKSLYCQEMLALGLSPLLKNRDLAGWSRRCF
ncbi:MAG: endo alpha-1,4 polygalactosaminidase [Methylocystaceae bacterium]|nr:endo alpha-1,4 polygalactosaminidase [Methylocystaceae bacterium]